jgi:hypothetical protein
MTNSANNIWTLTKHVAGSINHAAGKAWTKNPYKFGSKAHFDWETAMIDCYNKRFDEIIAKHQSLKEKY